jgi:pimeloyl-ACP methyl ester carboxylesterase
MPAVLVHGVPDTERSWDRLRTVLDRADVVTCSLPGFGCPRPDGFGATKEEYAAWLEAELDAIGGPVDLVAHDWGALLAQRVASVRPDLIRTLAVGSGPLDRAYTWHAMAQAWQTPEVGEQIMAGMLGMTAAELAAGLTAGGAPSDLARIEAAHVDATMAQCILALYRSAVTVGDEWQPTVDAMPARPATVFHGDDDPYVETDVAARIASRLGAELVVYDDCGHWWAWERPAQTAAALGRLWASA